MVWTSPQIFPELKSNQVHIWRAPLNCSKQQLLEFKATLNERERERANKFIVVYASYNFIVAR